MKTKSFISLFVFLMSFGLFTTSCEDMLTPDMDNYVDGDGPIRDTVYTYLGIINSVQNAVEQGIIIGESRGDLVSLTDYSSDSVSKIANFEFVKDGENVIANRAAYYNVVNQCNFYLNRADTLIQKNGRYTMRKEYAQVLNIRAWAYMQLVQIYGRVPFIVEPVRNADTGWETNPPGGVWADADNLVTLLKKDIETAELFEKANIHGGFPYYSTFNTGAGVSFASQLLLFPTDLIKAELYLLRGADKSDYETAAQCYYNYLEKRPKINSSTSFARYTRNQRGSNINYEANATPWINATFAVNATLASLSNGFPSAELQTAMPSAANASIGRVLTLVPHIYGFSVNSQTSNATSDGASVDGQTGKITITPDYKLRQLQPSKAYLGMANGQAYCLQDQNTKEEVSFPDGVGDARAAGSAPYVETNEVGTLRFIQKFNPATRQNGDLAQGGFTFRYAVPIYRMRQIYLHFAEALNRAGYPHFAFAILRDGLSENNIPALKLDTIRDNAAATKTVVLRVDSTSENLSSNISGGADYITVEELLRSGNVPNELKDVLPKPSYGDVSWMKFSEWGENSFGIHEFGCGISQRANTVYNFNTCISQRILDEATRTGFDMTLARKYSDSIKSENVFKTDDEDPTITYTVVPLDMSLIKPLDGEYLAVLQNAVETYIAEESALETAFEGSRFFDLMRMARHKNKDSYLPANYGTEWLAWMVARRSLDLAPYASPTSYDNALYTKLLDPNNWFLANPQ